MIPQELSDRILSGMSKKQISRLSGHRFNRNTEVLLLDPSVPNAREIVESAYR